MARTSVSAETRAKMAAARRRWWETATPEKRAALIAHQRGPRPRTSAALKGKPRGARGTSAKQTVACAACGALLTRYPHQLAAHPHAFCNRACFGAWYSTHRRVDRPTVTCQTCGATFERLASRDKWTGGKHFCSRACAVAARSGENHHRWGGGRQKRPDGYVDISRALVPEAFRSMVRKDGRMMEHRLVMAQHLGRPLEDWEVVHHVDGQRDRNVIGNLELHPEHDHNGITAMTQRDRQIAALRAQIADLQGRIRELDPPP